MRARRAGCAVNQEVEVEMERNVRGGGIDSGALVGPHMLHILSSARRVRSHKDFFAWLQADVQLIIPHHTLIAAWGDLGPVPAQAHSSRIDLDISSALVPDATRIANSDEALPTVARKLYEYLDKTGSEWCLLRGRTAVASVCGEALDGPFLNQLRYDTRGILLHNLRCSRAGQDCLYVFLITDPAYRIDRLSLDILLPHLDLALRRVECLPNDADIEAKETRECLCALSVREHEVLSWVSEGKSNEEIGMILDISHNTVKNHLKRVFAKMGVSSRSQAVQAYVSAMGSRRPARDLTT